VIGRDRSVRQRSDKCACDPLIPRTPYQRGGYPLLIVVGHVGLVLLAADMLLIARAVATAPLPVPEREFLP